MARPSQHKHNPTHQRHTCHWRHMRSQDGRDPTAQGRADLIVGGVRLKVTRDRRVRHCVGRLVDGVLGRPLLAPSADHGWMERQTAQGDERASGGQDWGRCRRDQRRRNYTVKSTRCPPPPPPHQRATQRKGKTPPPTVPSSAAGKTPWQRRPDRGSCGGACSWSQARTQSKSARRD